MTDYWSPDIQQGASFPYSTTLYTDATETTPLDLTGASAALQIRKQHASLTAGLSLTSGNGITLGGAAGTVAINITPTQTRALVPGRYVWDFELTLASGQVDRLFEGDPRVTPEVTR